MDERREWYFPLLSPLHTPNELSVQGALLEEFEFVCIFASNLTGLRGALSPRVGAYGIMHWQLDFQICIHFDGDELAAHLEWEEEVQFTSLTKLWHMH